MKPLAAPAIPVLGEGDPTQGGISAGTVQSKLRATAPWVATGDKTMTWDGTTLVTNEWTEIGDGGAVASNTWIPPGTDGGAWWQGCATVRIEHELGEGEELTLAFSASMPPYKANDPGSGQILCVHGTVSTVTFPVLGITAPGAGVAIGYSTIKGSSSVAWEADIRVMMARYWRLG